MQTYLFYDIETTGLNKSFDQVLQFAAIRTDLAFNELDRIEIQVKLNQDVIPSPYAVITHHIGIQESTQGIDEFQAIKQIHQLLNHPGTISLGYNTLGFDDEFLRFAFYRNLLPPYTHQFANSCSRLDLYPMALMYYLYKPHVLEWPTREDKPSLKLEDLNQANQLASGRAHNAMVDVEVTLALAKRFAAETDMWNYLRDFFNKRIDQERVKPLQSNTVGLMIDGRLRKQAYQSLVLYLGQHRHYQNQFIWLQLDNKDIRSMPMDALIENTRITNKKLGEPNFILPLKDRFAAKILPEQYQLAEDNKQWLNDNPEILKQLSDHYTDYKYPQFPHCDVEASLYLQGFYSQEEQTFCRSFHQASPVKRAQMVEQLTFYPRLQELGLRVLGKHYPDVLTTQQHEKFAQYIRKIDPRDSEEGLIDFQGNARMTPQKALSDITTIRKEKLLSNEQEQLLQELELYLTTKFN